MRGSEVLGLIFANANEDAISEVTGVRSMASVPFGGGYRLVDFVLSNMVNSGITKVGVLTNNNYQSLMDHLGSGMAWDLARKKDGLYFLPPFNSQAIQNFNEGRIGALRNIMHFLQRSKQEYVLLSDCSYVANLDFTAVFNRLESSGADIVLLSKQGKIPTLTSQPVLNEVSEGRITKMTFTDEGGEEGTFALKAAFMKKSLLERLVNEAFAKGKGDLERELFVGYVKKLHMVCYPVSEPVWVIDSLQSYFDANFSLLQPQNYRALFLPSRPVYTKVYEDMPAVYGLGCEVKNSLVADGCVIEGKVKNCILFRDCRIEKDACVENSILMPHTFVAQGARVSYCITDKSVAVRSQKQLSGADTYPVYIGKGIHI